MLINSVVNLIINIQVTHTVYRFFLTLHMEIPLIKIYQNVKIPSITFHPSKKDIINLENMILTCNTQKIILDIFIKN